MVIEMIINRRIVTPLELQFSNYGSTYLLHVRYRTKALMWIVRIIHLWNMNIIQLIIQYIPYNYFSRVLNLSGEFLYPDNTWDMDMVARFYTII